MRIHHIGYAVKNMSEAIAAFEGVGYSVIAEPFDDHSRNVVIAFMKNEHIVVELVSALNREQASPVDFVSKIKIPGDGIPYHFCYECENINDSVAELENLEYRLVVPPLPAPAIDGRNVAFMLNRHIGLIELLEAEK